MTKSRELPVSTQRSLMLQQEMRLKATIKAVQDSNRELLNEVSKVREYVYKVLDSNNKEIQECLNERLRIDNPLLGLHQSHHESTLKNLERDRSILERKLLKLAIQNDALKSYVSSIGVDVTSCDGLSPDKSLLHIRGLVDAWYMQQVRSFKLGLDSALSQALQVSGS